MKTIRLLAAIAAIVALAGCIQTLHPLYTDRDLIFEPQLVGAWSPSESPKETWVFARSGEKAYELVQTEEGGKSGRFEVHALRVNGVLFLDLFPKEPPLDATDFYKFHLRPMHSFLLVERVTPTLRMRVMESDWLEAYLKKNPSAIRHETVDGQIVLTAPTAELQAFVLAHVKTPGAFGEPSDMTRGDRP